MYTTEKAKLHFPLHLHSLQVDTSNRFGRPVVANPVNHFTETYCSYKYAAVAAPRTHYTKSWMWLADVPETTTDSTWSWQRAFETTPWMRKPNRIKSINACNSDRSDSQCRRDAVFRTVAVLSRYQPLQHTNCGHIRNEYIVNPRSIIETVID